MRPIPSESMGYQFCKHGYDPAYCRSCENERREKVDGVVKAARAFVKYQKPYDSITPAGRAWDRLKAKITALDKP